MNDNYIPKKAVTNVILDEWVQVNIDKNQNKKNYSYEDNLRKKLDRKRKNYLYKLNRNKKALQKYVSEKSSFINDKLEEGYTIIDLDLKKDINNKLDELDNKHELAESCDNLQDFLILNEEVRYIVDYINLKLNSTNLDQLILENKITKQGNDQPRSTINDNVSPSRTNACIGKTMKESLNISKPRKQSKKIDPKISFADMLRRQSDSVDGLQ